jgi:hypothetical protein
MLSGNQALLAAATCMGRTGWPEAWRRPVKLDGLGRQRLRGCGIGSCRSPELRSLVTRPKRPEMSGLDGRHDGQRLGDWRWS